MGYRYELHAHTKEGSICSSLPIKEMMALYHEMGYSGVCITDHFSGGTPLPNETPWVERVMFYDNVYQEARKEGEKLGLSVFFGIEYAPIAEAGRFLMPSREGRTDFLILGLTTKWLLENEVAFRGMAITQLRKMREAEAIVIHAHPFLDTEQLRLIPGCTDAVEVFNAAVSDFGNEAAKSYAQTYGFREVAGSDIHSSNRKVFAGVETEQPCATLDELIMAIIGRRAKPFSIIRE